MSAGLARHPRWMRAEADGISDGQPDLGQDFDQIIAELYGHHHEDNPYLIQTENGLVGYGWQEAGITCAMVHRFAVRRGIPVHNIWGSTRNF